MRIQAGKALIISPHVDDEVLGCHAFLSPECFVLYLGVEDRPEASRRDRLEEAAKSADKSGFVWQALDHPVNAYQITDLIPDLERVINDLRPATVLLPQPSYNQDHRATYSAGVTALRPHDRNWFAPNVFLFEQPDSVLWPHGDESEPNFFRPVDIESKLHSYSLYPSQVRGHRSPALVRSMAALRGAQAGIPFAEGYTCKRMVEGK